MSSTHSKALVLLSGGLDSSTLLVYAQQRHSEVFPLHFSYGQKASQELAACQHITQLYKTRPLQHIPLNFNLPSSLTLDSIDVPQYDPSDCSIPNTYVPGRNFIFLAIASAYAETLQADTIYIGATQVDYSGYPDCRQEFLQSFETCCQTALGFTCSGQNYLSIQAPLLFLKKSEIIRLGLDIGVQYQYTLSCYEPINDQPCRTCSSCALRQQGFEELGLQDPLFLDQEEVSS